MSLIFAIHFPCHSFFFFFFNDTATTEIYTLSLHDALPIFITGADPAFCSGDDVKQIMANASARPAVTNLAPRDRKSTRLNSSHANISYAVFCLKKKNLEDRYDLSGGTIYHK